MNIHQYSTPSPLHQALCLCGRVFALLCIALPLVFLSCEKEVIQYQEMVEYHAESLNLLSVTPDSVDRFSQKVETFVTRHPAAQEDPLYPKIQANIQAAMIRFTITVNDEWNGKTVINF